MTNSNNKHDDEETTPILLADPAKNGYHGPVNDNENGSSLSKAVNGAAVTIEKNRCWSFFPIKSPKTVRREAS
jgi:hypothetical protein